MMSLFAGCFVNWTCLNTSKVGTHVFVPGLPHNKLLAERNNKEQYELFVSYFIATVLHCSGKLLTSRADCLLLLFFKLWDVYSYYLSRYLPIYVALFAAMVKMLLACESHFDPPVIVIMHLLWNSRSTKLFIVLCHSGFRFVSDASLASPVLVVFSAGLRRWFPSCFSHFTDIIMSRG
jgi:hypothetical protein